MLDLVAVLGSYSLLTTAGYLTAHPELWNHINLQPTTAAPLQKGPERSCPTASSGSLAPMLCPNASSCVHLQVGKQRGEKPGLGWGRHWSVKINLRNSSRGLAKSESPCWFRVQPAVVLEAAAESIQLPLVELLGSESVACTRLKYRGGDLPAFKKDLCCTDPGGNTWVLLLSKLLLCFSCLLAPHRCRASIKTILSQPLLLQ